MRGITFILATAIYASASLAAPTPGIAFYLKVSGGPPITTTPVLRDNNTYDLGITPAPYYSNPPYGDHPLPISISTTNASELIVSPTNPHPGPISGRLALVVAGPDDYTLSKAFPQSGGGWNVGPDRLNAVVKTTGWRFVGDKLKWLEGDCWKWAIVKKVITPFDGPAYERWVVHRVKGTCSSWRRV